MDARRTDLFPEATVGWLSRDGCPVGTTGQRRDEMEHPALSYSDLFYDM
jgi:hypothetical protein